MSRQTLWIAASLSALLLAACGPRTEDDATVVQPATPAPAAATTPVPGEPVLGEPVLGEPVLDPAAPPPVTAATPPSAADTQQYPVARDACLAEVARQTGTPKERLVATEVLWAQAGVGVTVQVPSAPSPWSCLSDEQGKVQGAAPITPSPGR